MKIMKAFWIVAAPFIFFGAGANFMTMLLSINHGDFYWPGLITGIMSLIVAIYAQYKAVQEVK